MTRGALLAAVCAKILGPYTAELLLAPTPHAVPLRREIKEVGEMLRAMVGPQVASYPLLAAGNLLPPHRRCVGIRLQGQVCPPILSPASSLITTLPF